MTVWQGSINVTGMAKKLTANIHDDVAKLLTDLAEKRGVSVTEVVRSAISTEHFLNQELSGHGNKLLLKEPDGTLKEVVFNPTRS